MCKILGPALEKQNKTVMSIKYGSYHPPKNLDLQVPCAKLSAMRDCIG